MASMAPHRCPNASATRSMPRCHGPGRFDARPGPLRMFPMLPNVTARSGSRGCGARRRRRGPRCGGLVRTIAMSLLAIRFRSRPRRRHLRLLRALLRRYSMPHKRRVPETDGECFAPGRYAFGAGWPGEMSIAVPEGWFDLSPRRRGGCVPCRPEPRGGWLGLGHPDVQGRATVSRRPCDPEASSYSAPLVDTPGQLAGAMAEWPGYRGDLTRNHHRRRAARPRGRDFVHAENRGLPRFVLWTITERHADGCLSDDHGARGWISRRVPHRRRRRQPDRHHDAGPHADVALRGGTGHCSRPGPACGRCRRDAGHPRLDRDELARATHIQSTNVARPP